MVEYYESMAAKARCGEVQGAFGAADLASGGQHIYTCGTFVDDAALAVKIVNQGLDVLLDLNGLKKNEDDTNMRDYVPAGLRKGWGT